MTTTAQFTDAEYLVNLCQVPAPAPAAAPAPTTVAELGEPGQGMHPELIKAAIRMKGWTSKGIARSVGVSSTCVSHVINSRGVSHPVAKRISEITGIPMTTLWPGKYTKPANAPKTYSAPATH